MNYIREAENRLWYYRDLQKSVENIDHRIAKLIGQSAPKMPAMQISDIGPISGGRHDHDVNVLFEIQQLTNSKKETLEELEELKAILQDINKDPGCEQFGEILWYWYVEKLPREQIAVQLGYTERHIYRIKGMAIRKFAIQLFGIEALKVV